MTVRSLVQRFALCLAVVVSLGVVVLLLVGTCAGPTVGATGFTSVHQSLPTI